MQIHTEYMERAARLCVPECAFAAPKVWRSSTGNKDKYSDPELNLLLAHYWGLAAIQLATDY
jgi:hypothetical protein